jgi:hypothetical protein
VLRPDGEVVARFGPVHSEYPDHAAFSPDGRVAIFNACHFYNGVTVAVDTADLPGLDVGPYEEDPRVRVIEGISRVYASAFHDGAFWLGNASGYLHAVRPDGTLVWRHFCGSSLGGVAISPDRRHAVVTTAAGYLQFLELDAAERDPHQIGSSPHREVLRFVQWRDQPLLRW